MQSHLSLWERNSFETDRKGETQTQEEEAVWPRETGAV